MHQVLLSRCFPSPRTAGFGGMTDRRVLAVGDEPVLNLRQMYARIQKLHAAGLAARRGGAESAGFVDFELQCSGGSAHVVMPIDEEEETRRETMKLYRIPAHASPELLESRAEPEAGR